MKDKTLTREQIVWLRAKLVDLEDDGTEALCDMAEAYRRTLAQPAAMTPAQQFAERLEEAAKECDEFQKTSYLTIAKTLARLIRARQE